MPLEGSVTGNSAPRIWALRGATTAAVDTPGEILDATSELLGEIMARNEIKNEDIVSIVFTATSDLTSEFPAAAARELGVSDVPLLCARELDIQGGVERCVRILMHAYTSKARTQLRHVFLRNARQLRTDLPQ